MRSIYALFFAAIAANAALNDPCKAACTSGVCISTSSCSSSGGTSHTGFCPNDPANIKCCTKPLCGSASSRTLVPVGTLSRVGLCPGPPTFKCCLPGKPKSSSKSCGPTAVNVATVSLIKGFESFVPKPYLDPVGLETVGYGHLCKRPGCKEVPFSFPMTEAQATTLLQSDIAPAAACISADIVDTVNLNENQYGALVSWAFNIGCGNSRGSTLINRLNKGEDPNAVATDELPKWRKAGGKVLPGLVTRRNSEVSFFKRPSSVLSHPPSC
ncbi:unnamed protein product [Cyclocybe aegerita]|uniref:Lysozyme n=1 Tax=Cyclocybe aegerita TaxID=1973307 RepID=A0A8S0X3K8_CYCAE|nr:unnamed protein product [Cyclocybe aegerita]